MDIENGSGKMVLPSSPLSMGQMGRVTVSLYSAAVIQKADLSYFRQL